MPAASRRKLIIAALKARAATITVANGYFTNAGQRVEYGNAGHTTDDALPRVTLSVEDVEPPTPRNQHKAMRRLPVRAEIKLAPADALSPLDAAEDALADLKTALFEAGDRTLGIVGVHNIEEGREGVVDRADGSTLVGAWVEFAVFYSEKYGLPSEAAA